MRLMKQTPPRLLNRDAGPSPITSALSYCTAASGELRSESFLNGSNAGLLARSIVPDNLNFGFDLHNGGIHVFFLEPSAFLPKARHGPWTAINLFTVSGNNGRKMGDRRY
jgi:hypothetical protein